MQDAKVCSICHELKPLVAFVRDRTCSSGRAARCKACANAAKRAWYETHERKKPPSHAVRSICPHCGRQQKGAILAVRHLEQCPFNPPVAAALLAFLKDNATDGVIMPIRDYCEQCTAGRLPSQRVVTETVGGWADVASWAGLRCRPEASSHKGQKHALIEHVTVAELDASLPGGYTICSTRTVGDSVYSLLR